MTAEEKAREIVKKIYDLHAYETMSLEGKRIAWNHSKECAIIVCDECIKAISPFVEERYYTRVKQEIEKL